MTRRTGNGNPGRGGKQPGSGRPRFKGINLEEVEKLCSLQCTQEEIAAYFKVSRRTIETYAQKPEFKELFEQGRAMGKISVRRAQFRLLEAGSNVMAIWLGKQLLGQKDRQEFTGPENGPIEVSISNARERILSRIAQMSDRGTTPQGPGSTD